MSRKYVSLFLLIGASVMTLAIGCGTDTATSDVGQASEPTATSAPADTHADDDAHSDGDSHDSMDSAGMMDDHADDMHADDEHAHGDATVDPDAPVTTVVAKEFGYTPAEFEVEADHAFTIQLHNEGILEHDIVIEGHEELGGIHLTAGEEGMASFTLEHGEYTYYCTVPGHRDAGMTGMLTVEADSHG